MSNLSNSSAIHSISIPGHQQSEVPGRKALQFSPAHAAPPAAAVTTWQQQYMQQELQPSKI